MSEDWMRPMAASLRRRVRRRRIRLLLPVVSPHMDRLREAAMDGHRCQVIPFRPVLGPWPPAHWCPDCRVERADYERPGEHLDRCPNCGSAADPAPIPGGLP